MKTKLSLCIVAAFLVGLTACAQKPILKEPALVIKPFQYAGRTWFDTNKATLRPSGQKELKALSTHLMAAKQNGLISNVNKVVVIGHTDSRASRAYNQKLSERRAASVAKFLTTQGIPSASMIALGKGETQPVASNRTRSGMQQNRRVEIHIQGPAINVVYD